MAHEIVRAGVLGQAALALADGFARVLLEKGVISEAEYVRGFDLALAEWQAARDHPQHDEVLAALKKIHPGRPEKITRAEP
jgi:hypothetical protein